MLSFLCSSLLLLFDLILSLCCFAVVPPSLLSSDFCSFFPPCPSPRNAFLNMDGGALLVGIEDDGLVLGLHLPRETRDRIRLKIDYVCHHMVPSVEADLCKLHFDKVYRRVHDQTTGVHIPDRYVVRLEVSKGRGNILYETPNGKAWCRREGSVREMTPSDLKAHINRREIEPPVVSHLAPSNVSESLKFPESHLGILNSLVKLGVAKIDAIVAVNAARKAKEDEEKYQQDSTAAPKKGNLKGVRYNIKSALRNGPCLESYADQLGVSVSDSLAKQLLTGFQKFDAQRRGQEVRFDDVFDALMQQLTSRGDHAQAQLLVVEFLSSQGLPRLAVVGAVTLLSALKCPFKYSYVYLLLVKQVDDMQGEVARKLVALDPKMQLVMGAAQAAMERCLPPSFDRLVEHILLQVDPEARAQLLVTALKLAGYTQDDAHAVVMMLPIDGKPLTYSGALDALQNR